MKLVYDYMKEASLRHKLNTLAKKTFGLDFEAWVQGGYFEGDYIPYSFLEDGKLLANVSANKMHFIQNGISKYYIQIGTVMTDEAYRKQGLGRKLTEHVCREYAGKCDGIYLFGDLGALDFYRKMGFQEGLQYQYLLKKDCLKDAKIGSSFKKADGQDGQIKAKYQDAVRNGAINAALEQSNKYGLQMFYTADLEHVYYAADIDCFAVMEKQGDTLVLQSIICKKQISLRDIIARIDMEYDSLKLGFAPCAKDCSLFDAFVYDGEDDYRLFYLGEELESIQKEKLFFPQLSHA